MLHSHADQALEHVRLGALGEQRPSLSASATTTAAARTGSRPESTASFTGALAALANACATVTSCPAPPERVEGAQCRTQPTVVVACAPPVVSPRASASPTTATLRGVAGAGQRVQLTEQRPEVVAAGAPELGLETL